MIVNFILFLFTQVIIAAVLVLPDASLPTWITDFTTTLQAYFLNWGFIFPISSFLLLLGFFITVETAILAFYGVNAIIKVVRGSG